MRRLLLYYGVLGVASAPSTGFSFAGSSIAVKQVPTFFMRMFVHRGLLASILVVPKANALITHAFQRPTAAMTVRALGSTRQGHAAWTTTTRLMMSQSGTSSTPPIRHIGKAEMQSLLDMPDADSLVVIDVRTPDEVASTGKLAPHVRTFPVQVILQTNAFALSEDDFEEVAGFEKPSLDQTLVFSCAAGIRSVYACQAASSAGYSKLVNYAGGANEWFSS